MNSRALTLSLIIAGISMLMVYSYMEGQQANFLKQYGSKVAVVVAKEDIKELQVIDDRSVVVKQVPSSFKMPKAYSTVEELENTIALTPILKGEQITAPRVSPPQGSTGLARQVSISKRAISVRVSDDQAVSKLIKPGDRVDILARVDYAGGRKDLSKVDTVLQDVLVLSTGLSITNSLPVVGLRDDDKIKKLNLNTYSNYNTVTIEVDPFQAQKMIFLISVLGGRPYLTLRNNNDKERVSIKSTELYDVLGDNAVEAKQFFQNQNSRGNAGRGR